MALPSDRLLAKSWRSHEIPTPSVYLFGHLQDVHEAAKRVLEATGEDQLLALGLDPAKHIDRLRRCVLLAAATHDLGKANDHFQGMLTKQRNILQNPQGLRHEWATILMLQSLKKWLLPTVTGDELDFSIVEWAIAGHHPAPHHESPPKDCPAGAGVEITFLLGHPDGLPILKWIASTLAGVDPFAIPTRERVCRTLGESNSVFHEIARLWRSARRTWDEKVRLTEARKLTAAIKNCLIAADIAGSALPKAKPNDNDRWNWIPTAFANRPKPGNLETIYRTKLDGHSPRAFQQRVAESKDAVTFVKAGCGTGKTVAAYIWAARNHPTRRLYFCYPTTGTATEGFKDYLFEPEGQLGELGAQLFHSRRDIDFEMMLPNGADSKTSDQDDAAKLESLEAWSTPIVSCTVDTVLGIIQNNKRGLFAWPALAQSAFVFDEIHSYDDRLFGALIRFLRDLPGLPTLLMTASLPKARENALREALSDRGIELKPIEGPAELETLPRYHKIECPADGPMKLVTAELASGGKVLWVCNTVKSVMDAADRAKAIGLSPMIYHSRFKYEDRVRRHRAVVDAFTPQNASPALAICSQVAEMSLDLKGCTMLVTELAPVPSIIQRLGRLNRQASKGDVTRPLIVVEPEGSLPYTDAELSAAGEWLARLPAAEICQRDLSDKWEQTGDNPPEKIASAWLDGGPITSVIELREASPGISVLMREDVEILLKTKDRGHDVGRYTLPMPPPPKEMIWQNWLKYKGIPIAEPGFINYGRERGGQWEKQRNLPPLII